MEDVSEALRETLDEAHAVAAVVDMVLTDQTIASRDDVSRIVAAYYKVDLDLLAVALAERADMLSA